MEDWNIILTIITSTVIISFFSFIFAFKIKNHSVEKPLSGFSLLLFFFFQQIEKFLERALGPKFIKFAPIIIYFFFYVLLNTMLASFIGDPFVSPFQFPIFVLIYGVLLVLCILLTRIYFHGFRSLFAYLNPMELMSLVSSFISITFRLFGNLFAGYLILGLFYEKINSPGIPEVLRSFNVLALIALPLHFYFDIFSATLHITIFIMLSITYLSINRPANFSKN